MVPTLAQQPVGSLVREWQSRANVFERFARSLRRSRMN